MELKDRIKLAIDEAVASRKPNQCQALCEDYERPAYSASMQRIVVPGVKACSKGAKVQIGHLKLCEVHARMAREGFIDEDGTVAPKDIRNDHRRFPEKFKDLWFNWTEKLNGK